MKPYLIVTISLFVGLSVVNRVSAGTGQYGQYGGGTPSHSIVIDKMVMSGTQTKGGQQIYVDNLSPSNPRFAPGNRVYFQIKIKNTSNIDLTNVNAKDILPEWVDAVEGPGSYNPDTREISWSYSSLASGEEIIEHITIQVKPQDQLPADKGLMCLTNKATVAASGAADEDNSQFCIEKTVVMTTKGGQPVTSTPEAGAPLLAFGAINILGLGAGIFIKKRA